MKPVFVNKFSIITLLIVATATISLMACDANAQVLPEQPPTSGGSGETQAQPIETPPSSSEKTGEVNTGSDSENEFYNPNEVLIIYKDPARLAVISEDFASVGVDTAGLEIFGGIESDNTYFVRYNADIDPPQLSLQLRAIDRIDWAQPNYIYELDTGDVTEEESLDQIRNLETDSDSEDVEPICDPGHEYVPDEVIITYKDPAPVLENEDETGTIYLRGYGGYEATFVSRGLAVVSEDLASVGVDTADLEIFGGEESRDTYYVRYNDDIDSLQLVFQLRAIDRIGWVRLNYSPSTRSNYSYEPNYALDQVIITYKDPSRLAVISEDFASVGVDTADLEIVSGDESSNRYYVRYNAEIDPIPLSIQLETIDRIRRATPIRRLYTNEALDISSCALFRNQ